MALALKLLCNGIAATHYIVDNDELVLLSGPTERCSALLYPLTTTEELVTFVSGWLEKGAVYKEPCNGGDVVNEKTGWRAFCGPWGQDEKYPDGFARIVARYVWIGK